MHGHIDGGRGRPVQGAPGDGDPVALVHLALASSVASILRAGVRTGAAGPEGRAGVWCQPEPTLAAYAPPEPLRRALRRLGSRAVMAVHLRLPAGTPVILVHPDGRAEPCSAADAVRTAAALADPQACQVFVPRTITPREISRINHVPRLAGPPPAPVRHEPGQRPPRPARRRLDPTQRPLAKPQLLAPLVGASDPGDADELLRSAGPTSRGDAS